MRRRVFFALLLLALAATFGVGARSARAADPLNIYVILPMTGVQAFLGNAEAQALGVLQEKTNGEGGIAGRPVQFVIQDDQSNVQTGVQLANGIMAKTPPFIIGPSMAGVCSAVAPLMKSGPVNYCLTPGIHPSSGSWVYSAAASSADAFQAATHYFRDKGWKKIGVLTSIDASGQDGEHELDAALADPVNKNLVIVDREHFNLSDVSVSAQLAHIQSSGAQVLVAWSSGTPTATILRGALDLGLDLPILSSGANLTYAQMKNYAPIMPKELMFAGYPSNAPEQLPPGPTKDAVTAFLNAFKAKGIRADIGHAVAWDPAVMLIAALRKLGPQATAAQVKDYLDNLHSWVGALGPYDFRAVPQRGLGASSQIMVRWDPAKDTWVGISKLGGAALHS